jgi:hypothetical protein
MTMFSDKDLARFNSRFDRRGDGECWPWRYLSNHGGHGRMWAGGRNTLASHIALWLSGSSRPGEACALHSCDNPACVNPAHLRWGTQIENIADRVDRGRSGAPKGEASGRSKLTTSQVLAIRDDTRSSSIIAGEFGISRVMVCNIRSGRAWRHVGMDTEASGQANMPAMLSQAEEENRAVSVGDGGRKGVCMALPQSGLRLHRRNGE